jgi:hypothetical protein
MTSKTYLHAAALRMRRNLARARNAALAGCLSLGSMCCGCRDETQGRRDVGAPVFAPRTKRSEVAPDTTDQGLTREGEAVASGTDAIPKLASYRKHAGVERPRSQQVACGELGFVRLLPTGFEGYRYYDRGLTFRSHKRAFSHVVAQAGHSFLMVGPVESLVYYQPNTRLLPLARLPSLGPFQLWADVRSHQWVWVHYLRDDAVHRFELLSPSVDTEARASERGGMAKAAVLETLTLAGFDGTTVERKYSGEWIYERQVPTAPETVSGEVLHVSGLGKSGHVRVTGSTVALFATSTQTSALNVALMGYPFSMVESGGRVAFVTHRSVDRGREWQVEVIESSGSVHRVSLPNHGGSQRNGTADAFAMEVSDRSLCLVPGRPWVVVGGKTKVQLLEYQTGVVLLAL